MFGRLQQDRQRLFGLLRDVRQRDTGGESRPGIRRFQALLQRRAAHFGFGTNPAKCSSGPEPGLGPYRRHRILQVTSSRSTIAAQGQGSQFLQDRIVRIQRVSQRRENGLVDRPQLSKAAGGSSPGLDRETCVQGCCQVGCRDSPQLRQCDNGQLNHTGVVVLQSCCQVGMKLHLRPIDQTSDRHQSRVGGGAR